MTEPTGLRKAVKEALTLPRDWGFISEQRVPDQITSTTVILKHTRIEKLSEAPIGNLRNTIVCTVATPHADIAKAENALDEAVVELITALDGHKWLDWTDAQKVSVEGAYLGWDITLTAITQKEN